MPRNGKTSKRTSITRFASPRGGKQTFKKTKIKSSPRKTKIKTKTISMNYGKDGYATHSPKVTKTKFKVKNGKVKKNTSKTRGGFEIMPVPNKLKHRP